MNNELIRVDNLYTSFYTHLGEVQAIRGISFHVNKGEAIGIVGESGSGKSVTAMSVMNLLQSPGKIKSGEVIFKNNNIVNKTEREMLKIRGKEISMIFQDPMTSLNPVYTIGNQIIETIKIHKNLKHKEALEKSIEMLRLVGIPSPEERIYNYPHEMSGGMRQRAMIAMSLACQPDLLIADEPTTALDVTIQAQILELLKELKNKLDMAIILITHDLGVVADLCSRIIVMYGGLIMEEGSVRDIFYNPQHPYTKGLLKSVPSLEISKDQRLLTIPGNPPDLLYPPKGCPFARRCNEAMNICLKYKPDKYKVSDNHTAMCWKLFK